MGVEGSRVEGGGLWAEGGGWKVKVGGWIVEGAGEGGASCPPCFRVFV